MFKTLVEAIKKFLKFVQGLIPAILLKKRLWRKCFPVSLAKLLITALFIKRIWWLLISFTALSLHFYVGTLLGVLYLPQLYSIENNGYFWENHCKVFHLMAFQRISKVESGCFELCILRIKKTLCCLFHMGLSPNFTSNIKQI